MKHADRIFLVVLALTAVLRLALLATSQGGAMSDEALTGLMALDIMHGRAWPVYPYGYTYNGGAAMTAYVAAGVFRVAGVSDVSLKLVPLGVSLLYMTAVYGFVRRRFGPGAGLFAAVLLAADPGLVTWSLDARGGQGIHLLLTALLSIVFYRIYFDGVRTRRWYFLFGLVAGLGYWNFPFMASLAGGFALLLLLHGGWRFIRRGLPLLPVGFIAGMGPPIAHALLAPAAVVQHPAPLQLDPAALPRGLVEIASRTLPALFAADGVDHAYAWILLLVLLVCVLCLAWSARSGLRPFLRSVIAWGRPDALRESAEAKAWPMFVFIAVYLPAAAMTRQGSTLPRYLLPVHPFVVILAAAGMARLMRRKDRMRTLGRGAAAVFVAIGLGVQCGLLFEESATIEDRILFEDGRMEFLKVRNADVADTVGFLEAEGIACAYAPMELRSRIMFRSRGAILVTSRRLTRQYDYLPETTRALERRIDEGEPWAIVVRDDLAFVRKGRNWEPGFESRWTDFLRRERTLRTLRMKVFGDLVVLYDFGRDVRRSLP